MICTRKDAAMKKALALLILLLSPCLLISQTVTYRPNTDVDFYSVYSPPLLSCGTGQYVATGTDMLPDYYDAAGAATADDFELNQTDVPGGLWQARIVKGFPHTSGTHQSINLVVISHGFTEYDSQSLTRLGLWYSTNAGQGWVSIHQGGNIGWNWTTDNISLATNQDLSNVWVKVCDRVSGFGTSEVDLFVSDIRADVTN
jgi:hypothetical protein